MLLLLLNSQYFIYLHSIFQNNNATIEFLTFMFSYEIYFFEI